MTHPTYPHSFFAQRGAVGNRILRYKVQENGPHIVFVPNWRGKEKHWRSFIDTLAPHAVIDYFESREKPFTQKPKTRIPYTLEAMGSDLADYLNQLEGPYHLIGASIGASSMIKGWGQLRHKPTSVVLLCPVINLNMPAYFRLFKYITPGMIRVVRPFFLFLMLHSKKLRALTKGIYRAFKSEDPSELLTIKYSGEDLLHMQISQAEIHALDVPTFIGYAPDDGIHLIGDAKRLMAGVAKSEGCLFPSFRAVHQAETAQEILAWYEHYGFLPTNRSPVPQEV